MIRDTDKCSLWINTYVEENFFSTPTFYDKNRKLKINWYSSVMIGSDWNRSFQLLEGNIFLYLDLVQSFILIISSEPESIVQGREGSMF